MDGCRHTWTSGRQDEKGSWCQDCGEKVYDVETRTCEGCANYKPVFAGAICKRHMMAVSPSMHVTFKIAEGTCWQDKTNTPDGAPATANYPHGSLGEEVEG